MKRMDLFRRTTLTILLAAVAGLVSAQDVHFSQFYNSPLTLNPALTGKVNGLFRVGINYRNQWFGPIDGKTAFSTPSIYIDKPFAVKKDAVGIGGYIFNDRSAEGKLTNMTIMVGGAYHKALGANSKHGLSLGVHMGYVQKRLDYDNIRFGDQINLAEVSTAQSTSGESLPNTSTGNFDMQAGLAWGARFSKRFSANAGVGLFHILTPEQTFTDPGLSNVALKVPMRTAITGGFDAGLTEKLSLLPSVIYMQQSNARELNLGTALGLKINTETTGYLGVYYRVNDAVIPYIGLDYQAFKVGLSYDANVSELDATNGSVEVSLTYVGKASATPNTMLICPRF